MRVFLSHSSMDKKLVKNVYDNLTGKVAWIDEIDIENGDSIPEKIGDGIRSATHFVLFWSIQASRSRWVNAEINTAYVQMIASECKFMIFNVDGTELPTYLQSYKAEISEKFGEKEINFSVDLIPDA